MPPGTLGQSVGLGWPEDRGPLVGTLVALARGGGWAAVDKGMARPLKQGY
jgi:hypothetical protein